MFPTLYAYQGNGTLSLLELNRLVKTVVASLPPGHIATILYEGAFDNENPQLVAIFCPLHLPVFHDVTLFLS